MTRAILLALGLVLIIEGLFPFAAPQRWRVTFRRITALPPHRIRVGGLLAVGLGLLLLLLR